MSDGELRNNALRAAADSLRANRGDILAANAVDMEAGRQRGLSAAMLDRRMLDDDRVTVAFGEEVDEPSLRRCALVATHYGGGEAPLGVLGVIGPTRMNYARVIPLVEYLSQVITEKMARSGETLSVCRRSIQPDGRMCVDVRKRRKGNTGFVSMRVIFTPVQDRCA